MQLQQKKEKKKNKMCIQEPRAKLFKNSRLRGKEKQWNILACFKRFMHNQKDRVKPYTKKKRAREIQPHQYFHKNLVGLRR